MADTRLVKTARACAIALLDEGEKHRRWSGGQREQWTKAFNALQRLAGRRQVLESGRLVKDRRR